MNAQAEAWLNKNRGNFKPEHFAIIQENLKNMDDAKSLALIASEIKNPMTLFIVELFLGYLGVHRFMLKESGMGILYFLTGGICGLGWLLDLFTIIGKTKEFNYRSIQFFF